MFDWTWHEEQNSNFVEIRDDNKDVTFHPRLSNGTAVVRGTQAMYNDQHYWEVEMASPVYGTDVMIGVGTSEADMSQVRDRFISLLGMDNKTWGLSYTGQFHHGGEARDYGPRFVLGSVIGVHLDMWNGTLSFYKNRKSLGVASRGLKGKILYAMASSTAARSRMRIIRSCSFPSSLQFLCCSRLREIIPEEKNVLDAIPIPPGLQIFLQNNLSWLLDKRNLDDQPLNYESDPKYKSRSSAFEFNRTIFEQITLGDIFDDDLDRRSLRSRVSFRSTRDPVLLGYAPYRLHNNRFQQTERPTEQQERNVEENGTSDNESSSCDTHSLDLSDEENVEEQGSFGERRFKRRRGCTAYLLRRSDPDSD